MASVDWKNLTYQEKNAYLAVTLTKREYWPGTKSFLQPDLLLPGEDAKPEIPPDYTGKSEDAERLLRYVCTAIERGVCRIKWERDGFDVTIEDSVGEWAGRGVAKTRPEAICHAILDLFGVEFEA